MKMRPADFNDINPLMDVTRRCIENLDQQGIYQWDENYPSKKDFRDDILEESLYVMAEAEKLCGCICVNQVEHPGYENADWHGSRFLVIHKMMIDPANEGHGIGKLAMQYAEKIAKSDNKDSIRLDCFKENLRANRFYQRLGYIVRGEALFRKGLFNLYEKLI